MSKSYDNIIPLFGTDEQIQRAIGGIVTDSHDVDEPKDPEGDTLVALHRLVSPDEVVADIERRYREGGIGYKEVKEQLVDSVIAFISPLRTRYQELQADAGAIEQTLTAGAARASKIADEKIAAVRAAVGVGGGNT